MRRRICPYTPSFDERYERAMEAALADTDTNVAEFLQKLYDATEGCADYTVERALSLIGDGCCRAV